MRDGHRVRRVETPVGKWPLSRLFVVASLYFSFLRGTCSVEMMKMGKGNGRQMKGGKREGRHACIMNQKGHVVSSSSRTYGGV